MKFFVDRCFPLRLMKALAIIEERAHQFTHLDEHFDQATPDVDWLRAIGGWTPKPIVLSGDARILTRRDEVQELMAQDLFFVTMYGGWPDQNVYEQTWKFFKVWPKIVEELGRCKAPTVFKIVPAASGLENLGLTQRFRK